MNDSRQNSTRGLADREAQDFFEGIWRQGDYWNLEKSPFELLKYERLLALLKRDHQYPNVLEIGCGSGSFTRRLAPLAEHVLALDIASAAIAQAQATRPRNVEYRVENVLWRDFSADPPWDLVVMSETIYYLGWLYPFFNVAWLAYEIYGATRAGGRYAMANTRGGDSEQLMLPWIIQTYRDLFVNVGFVVDSEAEFRGTKDGVPLETLISVFRKP